MPAETMATNDAENLIQAVHVEPLKTQARDELSKVEQNADSMYEGSTSTPRRHEDDVSRSKAKDNVDHDSLVTQRDKQNDTSHVTAVHVGKDVTPLMLACQKGKYETVKSLIDSDDVSKLTLVFCYLLS